MNSFLDMAIPGLRCLNPGCQAEAPMGNRITFRQILYKGWTCSYCGWEYSGALVGEDGMFTVEVEVDEGEPAGDSGSQEMVIELSMAEQAEAAHLPSRDEMEKDQVEQPKILDDMGRGELVAELYLRGFVLENVPFEGRAVSNQDIRAFVVSQLPTTDEEKVKQIEELEVEFSSGEAVAIRKKQEHRTE